MDLTRPKEVVDFEAFIGKAGLVCLRREELPAFGDEVLEYNNSEIGVRVGSDMGIWYIEVADVVSSPDKWYDAGILRDLLFGHGNEVSVLSEQIEIIEKNWPAIVTHFSSPQRQETHTRLDILKNERAERRYPGLYRKNSPG